MTRKVGPHTSGGVHISESHFNASKDITIVGGNHYSNKRPSRPEIDQLFKQVTREIDSTDVDNRPAARQHLEDLKQEVEKGEGARDPAIATLLEGLAKLAPQAISSLTSAFAEPFLSGVKGPVTQFVLSKILG
jgi:hypothetical protein